MKVKTITPKFEAKIEIVFENRSEVIAFWHRMNLPTNAVFANSSGPQPLPSNRADNAICMDLWQVAEDLLNGNN